MKVKGESFRQQQEKLEQFSTFLCCVAGAPVHIYVYELEISHAQMTVVGRLDADKRPSAHRTSLRKWMERNVSKWTFKTKWTKIIYYYLYACVVE